MPATTPVPLSVPHPPPLPAGRAWRFVLPLLALTLLVGAVGGMAFRSMREEIRRETDRTLAVITEQKKQQVEAWLAESAVDARLYVEGSSGPEQLFVRWLAGGRRDAALLAPLRERLQQLATLRRCDGVAVLDAQGRVVVSVGEVDPRPWQGRLPALLAAAGPQRVDLHAGPDGVVRHGLLAPLGGPAGSRPGLVYLGWRADRALFPLVAAWPVPTQTAETYLVRREGDRVRFLTPLRHAAPDALGVSRPLSEPDLPAARAARGELGILTGGRDYRQVPVLAYAAPIAGTPWLMLAEIDETEAYAGVRRLAWGTAAVMAMGLLALGAVALTLWRRERQGQALAVLRAQQVAESRFRVMFEQSPLGVALLAPGNGRLIEANQRLADIVDRPLASLAGEDLLACLHPEDVTAMRAVLDGSPEAEAAPGVRLTRRFRRPGGDVVWVSLTCAPVRVTEAVGAAPAHLLIAEDISASRAMQERLRLSEERHRLIADKAVDVILTLDLEGRYTYISPSVERLRGYTPQEVLRQRLSDVLAPGSLPLAAAYLERLRAAVRDGGPLESFRGELEQRRKDGSTVWTEVTATPLLSSDGQVVEILGVTRDIGERRRHEAALQRATEAAEAANAAKSEFLAHMSHEIRTPMNAVLGLAQVLAREPLSAAQREMVERIRAAGQSLLAILNDVLDLSKIEAGQLRLEPRPFELQALLASLDSLMGQNARARGLVLHVDPAPPGLGPLLGDGLRLEQVLFNLVGNAIKFTEAGSVEVALRVHTGEGDAVQLRFEVHDTGIGITPEALAGLFAPFTQADAGIGRRFGGTGLGLSICKRLVELMGGSIGAASEPGEGSTFWFELPMRRAAALVALPPPVARPRPAGPRLAGAHLLVVDDSAMNRDLVERALRLEGASATLAGDGQQAVQWLRTRAGDFDAVLMDVQMPVMDGLTALRLIRGELGLRELPVIAFTAGVRPEQQAAAREAGADDVLPKPMDLEQMAEVLARWIRPAGVAEPSPGSSAEPVAGPQESTSGAPAGPSAPGGGLADGFPSIAGIDRDGAMRRLGGDHEMFIGLLQRFAEDNAGAVDRTRAALQAGDREQAARGMHTLGSNAGFLCATALMDAARAVEAAIDAGAEVPAADLDAVDGQVQALIAASRPWC